MRHRRSQTATFIFGPAARSTVSESRPQKGIRHIRKSTKEFTFKLSALCYVTYVPFCGQIFATMIIHLIDGTYELFRHFYGIRRFKRSEERRVGKECRSRWSP